MFESNEGYEFKNLDLNKIRQDIVVIESEKKKIFNNNSTESYIRNSFRILNNKNDQTREKNDLLLNMIFSLFKKSMNQSTDIFKFLIEELVYIRDYESIIDKIEILKVFISNMYGLGGKTKHLSYIFHRPESSDEIKTLILKTICGHLYSQNGIALNRKIFKSLKPRGSLFNALCEYMKCSKSDLGATIKKQRKVIVMVENEIEKKKKSNDYIIQYNQLSNLELKKHKRFFRTNDYDRYSKFMDSKKFCTIPFDRVLPHQVMCSKQNNSYNLNNSYQNSTQKTLVIIDNTFLLSSRIMGKYSLVDFVYGYGLIISKINKTALHVNTKDEIKEYVSTSNLIQDVDNLMKFEMTNQIAEFKDIFELREASNATTILYISSNVSEAYIQRKTDEVTKQDGSCIYRNIKIVFWNPMKDNQIFNNIIYTKISNNVTHVKGYSRRFAENILNKRIIGDYQTMADNTSIPMAIKSRIRELLC